MVRTPYLDMLRQSAKQSGNCACMGLDPQLETLVDISNDPRNKITSFFERLLSAMSSRGLIPAAFKPNLGFYSSLDRPLRNSFSGSLALADVISLVRSHFNGIPIILDSKRGDIARSSENYADEAFLAWEADAVTVSPFMGRDSIHPFEMAADGKRGVYVLNRTSNKSAVELQNSVIVDPVDEKELYPLYQSVAVLISSWAAERPGTGAVVGAVSIDELQQIASWYAHKEIPMLIPGVGSQGASAAKTIEILRASSYDPVLARINSSSALTHPWKHGPAPDNWLDRCLTNIEALLKETAL